MKLTPWDPWQEWQRLRQQTDQLFDQFLAKLNTQYAPGEPVAFLPEADLVETAGEYRLYLFVPGLVEEDIDILVERQSVTIRGLRQPPYDPEHAVHRAAESRYGLFERRFQFPRPIGTGPIRAAYEAGVLTVLVPKSHT